MNVAGLYRYPVKGLSAERLRSVSLVAGYGFPKDRVYAVTDGSLAFDEANPQPAPKTQFLMLAKHERLAQLHTQFVDAEETLHVRDAQGVTRAYRLDRPEDREALAHELGRQVGVPVPGVPRVVFAEGHQFTDVSVHGVALMRSISLINLATVRDLSARLGMALDPLRFRGNLLFDGAPPWSELEWVGRTLTLGDVRMRIVRRTKRCAATSVNPTTAERDVNLPLRIRELQGHGDLGVYAEVLAGGTLSEGASFVLDDATPEAAAVS
jgi:uncharacterized protein YcbX